MAALLRSLLVKQGLLALYPFYQFLNPIKSIWIDGSGRHALVVLDLAVEFDALVTHCILAL